MTTSSNQQLASVLDGTRIYMRGAAAIRAELTALRERASDDPFINGLRDLQAELALLEQIDLEPEDVSVYNLDSAAEPPEAPVRPKKTFVLMLSVAAGLALGVFVSILLTTLRRLRALASQ